jgi:mRNA-degrading endonuclease RelE of RelBE toxin-antitoxin system
MHLICIMSCNILNTAEFSKELKKLSKKYPSLKNDYLSLLYALKENPFMGKSLGNNVFKIRMPIKSKSAGKSSGARVITFVRIIKNEILMISIYDKSEQESITEKEINERIKKFFV